MLTFISGVFRNVEKLLAESKFINYLKVVSNEMNGGLDVVSIESYYYITQVLGLSLSFYWAVVF